MRTVGQVLNSAPSYRGAAVDSLPDVGGIGIELELESSRSFRDVAGWARITDGSLRNGVEYVFDGPQKGEVALASILAMGEYLQRSPADPSFRCSTHIHMDVRDLGFDELEKLVLTYCLYEGVMFDHCSPERRFSNFCVPFFINDSLVQTFAGRYKGAASPRGKLNALSQWPKYTGLNLKVTPEIGSVEFRGSHALTTSEELLGLAQRMLHLKRLVKTVQADSAIQYVQALRRMPLDQAFPTGLRQRYAQDQELADIGYSNAMFIAAAQWAYDEAAPAAEEVQPVWDTPRVRPAPRRAEITDMWVQLNTETWATYNIDPSVISSHPGDGSYKRLQDVLRVYRALQSIRGVQPPTVDQLVREGTAHELSRHFTREGISQQFDNLGLSNPWV